MERANSDFQAHASWVKRAFSADACSLFPEGKGVIYKGNYIRRGFYSGAPFYDGSDPFGLKLDCVDGTQGPHDKPFGNTNIL